MSGWNGFGLGRKKTRDKSTPERKGTGSYAQLLFWERKTLFVLEKFFPLQASQSFLTQLQPPKW
jgi:hypothetical protein